jgi:multidrug efflux system outer membrane protein
VRRRTSGIVVTVLMLMTTACMMGPDYKKPNTEDLESWRLSSDTSESIANLPWWEVLKDRELQKLIRTALKENLDLLTAMASIEEFRSQLTIAKFDLMPSAFYSGNAFVFHSDSDGLGIPSPGGGTLAVIPGGGRTLSNESANAGIKWELDLWGRIRRSIEATRAQLLSQEENQRAVVLGLVSNVAEAYFDLRALDLQLDITKRTLATWEESVKLSRLRFEHGDIPKLDLDRFEAERAGTAARLAELEQQAVQKENQISILLGHRPSEIPRGLGLNDQALLPEVPVGLPSELLQRRPDILQSEQQLAAATANIGIAQALRFPQVSLTGIGGVSAFQVSSLSQGPFMTAAAAGSLSGPLLNATALGYQVKVSEAKAKQALAQYRKTILTAFKEVEDALIAVQKSREQRRAQEQQVSALQSAWRLAVQRYQGGRASYLDVLTAQRTLFDAELALVNTRRHQVVSMVHLYKALGGGWSPAGAGSPAEAHRVPG